MNLAYKLVIFDLDGTLAPSKEAMTERMAHTLISLLTHVPVAVISGGQFRQFDKQLLQPLARYAAGFPVRSETTCDTSFASGKDAIIGNRLDHTILAGTAGDVDGTSHAVTCLDSSAAMVPYQRLHLLPTCGTQYFRYEAGEWRCCYRQDLDPKVVAKAKRVVQEVCQDLGLWEPVSYGERIEDRGSQLTFSALGQEAPLELKAKWDPTGEKRVKIASAAQALLPELTVRSGGSTSVDLTMKGVDKAYGINHLLDLIGLSPQGALFVGDRLDPDGNDFPAISTGVCTRQTSGWEETCQILDAVLAGEAVH